MVGGGGVDLVSASADSGAILIALLLLFDEGASLGRFADVSVDVKVGSTTSLLRLEL